MVRRRVRAMLARSVLIPVAISRAVFGHKNTNSPMSFLRRGPEHCSFGGLWEHAAANESCGKLWKSVDTSFDAVAATHRLWVAPAIVRRLNADTNMQRSRGLPAFRCPASGSWDRGCADRESGARGRKC